MAGAQWVAAESSTAAAGVVSGDKGAVGGGRVVNGGEVIRSDDKGAVGDGRVVNSGRVIRGRDGGAVGGGGVVCGGGVVSGRVQVRQLQKI